MCLPGSSETAKKFIGALRMRSQDCNFKDPEEMMGDRIVFVTNSLKVREKLSSKGATKAIKDSGDSAAPSHESKFNTWDTRV